MPHETHPRGVPQAGEILAGKYVIEGLLGAGAMGVVLAATDRQLSRPVAIKFLMPSLLEDPEAATRFIREARAAAAIQSEHVVRIIEVGALPTGAPYMVMERLRGGDLAQVLRQRGRLPIAEAVEAIIEACDALAEAHVLGIVHRDVKPGNLYIAQRADGSGVVKVLDFGISKARQVDAGASLTGPSAMVGSPLYMSPEQVRGLATVDACADIWALGVVLFELLAGRPIFEAETTSALCAKIIAEAPQLLCHVRPDAPKALEAIIAHCMQKDPSQRFQDVAQLVLALGPFASARVQPEIERIQRLVHGSAATRRAGASDLLAPPHVLPMGVQTTAPWSGTAAPASPPIAPRKRRTLAIALALLASLVAVGASAVAWAYHHDAYVFGLPSREDDRFADAVTYANHHDLANAHAFVETLSAPFKASNAEQIRTIENLWADDALARAAGEKNRDAQALLCNQVIAAAYVDDARKQRARDMVQRAQPALAPSSPPSAAAQPSAAASVPAPRAPSQPVIPETHAARARELMRHGGFRAAVELLQGRVVRGEGGLEEEMLMFQACSALKDAECLERVAHARRSQGR